MCPVRANAERIAGRPALITEERIYSWAELDELVSVASAYLFEIGPSASRFAVQMPNSAEFVALVLAAFRTGHVLVPISTRLPHDTSIGLVEEVGAVVLITSTSEFVWRPDSKTWVDPIPLARPATIVHTSGSMGTPKAALLKVGNHVWSARGLSEVISLNAKDRWLLTLPLYHVGGLAIVYRCALAGAAIVLPGSDQSIGESIEAFSTTHASLVSTQLFRLLKGEARLDSLRAVLLGGSAISSDLIAAAKQNGLPIYTSYGLTEMASTVTIAADFDAYSSGHVLPYRELTVRGGEIHVRGKTRFAGYVESDQLRAQFDPEGWFATGDMGYFDDEGRLHVTGRMDNQFISGGENIQPEEIERILEALPSIVQAIVVPLADEEFGHRPVAFVSTREELDVTTLLASLEGQLPRFKLPVAIHSSPPSQEFKPSRSMLRQEAERLRS